MILKKVTHFFAKNGLAAHEDDTRAAIAKYERKKEESEFRINECLSLLRENLQSQSDLYDADINTQADQFNAIIGFTDETQNQVKRLYDEMFKAFEVWGRIQINGKNLAIEFSKRQIFHDEIKLFNDALTALHLLAESEDRLQWKKKTLKEPMSLESPHIEREMGKVERWKKEQDKEYAKQRDRILSAIRENKTKLSLCSADVTTLKNNVYALEVELRGSRELVKQTYKVLQSNWHANIDSVKAMYVGKCDELNYDAKAKKEEKKKKENKLNALFGFAKEKIKSKKKAANSPSDWGNLKELRDSLTSYKSDINDLFDYMKMSQEDITMYADKIKQARSSGDYDTFDSDKKNRNEAYQQKEHYKVDIAALKPKTKELGFRVANIRKILDLLYKMSPATYVESMFEMCLLKQDDGAEMYWKAINIRTKNLTAPTKQKQGQTS